jgi:hypothetical protein
MLKLQRPEHFQNENTLGRHRDLPSVGKPPARPKLFASAADLFTLLIRKFFRQHYAGLHFWRWSGRVTATNTKPTRPGTERVRQTAPPELLHGVCHGRIIAPS